MMSCDWFQPYKQSKYCVGVHYLTILNLPQSIQFRPENALFAGIIPGLKEPSQLEMNSHLRPLVKELNMSWIDGFEMKKMSLKFKLIALVTVCDIPATQNLCGFVGHSFHLCCCKCKKDFSFSDELNCVNFSGADPGDSRK